MTLHVCTFCGPRDLEEFHFRKTLPEPASTPVPRVYERLSRTDISIEHWQHLRGCRAWLLVHRNPSTGDVLLVRTLGGASKP
ncbi:MAG: sarcosine oxidase subunit delta [Steroidobacteraceae bacterium]